MTSSPSRVLELHRELVACPSVSHQEKAVADLVEGRLRHQGVEVQRLGDNVLARAGRGPRLLLNSHLDTVPPSDQWSRDPWQVEVQEGRIYGLGSNDAKASAAAMMETLLQVHEAGGPCEVVLLLVPEEETGGRGTELAWPMLREQGWIPEGVVVGEPTGLEIAVAQKGLLVLEILASGDACHPANAAALGARNAVRALARDLVALDTLDFGPEHPLLGRTTLEPTLARAGQQRNMLPDSASCFLDLRTVPGISHATLTERIRDRVQASVRVHSDRLTPRQCREEATVVQAALAARPTAHLVGSSTMSDLVFFEGVPAIKCGPGQSARSHAPDEFVLESEILEGARFYWELAGHLARITEGVRP